MYSITVNNGIVCISDEYETIYLLLNQIAIIKVTKKKMKKPNDATIDGFFSVCITTKNDDNFYAKISLTEKDDLINKWLNLNEIRV